MSELSTRGFNSYPPLRLATSRDQRGDGKPVTRSIEIFEQVDNESNVAVAGVILLVFGSVP